MAAEVVNPAKGLTLSYAPFSVSPTYTVLGQIVSIDKIERKVGTRDTKTLTSNADTFASTIVKNGQLTGTLLYDPKGTSHALLEGITNNPPLVNPLWKVTLPDTSATTLTFSGVWIEFSPSGMEVEENLAADFGIQISGLVTLT